jgi:hypothetical protein
MAREQVTKLPGGMLRYCYVLDEDAGVTREAFALSNVSEPYKDRFLETIGDKDWIVEFSRTLQESPYRADFVICTVDAAI